VKPQTSHLHQSSNWKLDKEKKKSPENWRTGKFWWFRT